MNFFLFLEIENKNVRSRDRGDRGNQQRQGNNNNNFNTNKKQNKKNNPNNNNNNGDIAHLEEKIGDIDLERNGEVIGQKTINGENDGQNDSSFNKKNYRGGNFNRNNNARLSGGRNFNNNSNTRNNNNVRNNNGTGLPQRAPRNKSNVNSNSHDTVSNENNGNNDIIDQGVVPVDKKDETLTLAKVLSGNKSKFLFLI